MHFINPRKKNWNYQYDYPYDNHNNDILIKVFVAHFYCTNVKLYSTNIHPKVKEHKFPPLQPLPTPTQSPSSDKTGTQIHHTQTIGTIKPKTHTQNHNDNNVVWGATARVIVCW